MEGTTPASPGLHAALQAAGGREPEPPRLHPHRPLWDHRPAPVPSVPRDTLRTPHRGSPKTQRTTWANSATAKAGFLTNS